MTNFQSSPMLRNILVLDAVTCIGAGLLLLVGAGYLANFLALPELLLRYSGLFLIAFGCSVAIVARMPRPGRAVVVAIIAANAIWAIESLALLFTGWVAPNGAGVGLIVAQATGVALLAVIQTVCLLRDAPATEALAQPRP